MEKIALVLYCFPHSLVHVIRAELRPRRRPLVAPLTSCKDLGLLSNLRLRRREPGSKLTEKALFWQLIPSRVRGILMIFIFKPTVGTVEYTHTHTCAQLRGDHLQCGHNRNESQELRRQPEHTKKGNMMFTPAGFLFKQNIFDLYKNKSQIMFVSLKKMSDCFWKTGFLQ